MSFNLRCLNPAKNEFVILGLPAEIKKISDPSILLSTYSSSLNFTLDSPVGNLGITFNPYLSSSNNVSILSLTCFMHTCNLRRIRPMLGFKTAFISLPLLSAPSLIIAILFSSMSNPPKLSVSNSPKIYSPSK